MKMTESPRVIQGRDGRCAYRGCTKHGDLRRLGRWGAVILYCDQHYRQATSLFDRDRQS